MCGGYLGRAGGVCYLSLVCESICSVKVRLLDVEVSEQAAVKQTPS